MAWLYDLVTADEDGREPQYAEQSAVNWITALAFEVTHEHGLTPTEQVLSARRVLTASVVAKGADVHAVAIYEPLFRAITNAVSLGRLAVTDGAAPWHRPAAAVTWYYTAYASLAALFAANGQVVGDNHSAARRTFVNSWQMRMPHPFNMIAKRSRGESYDLALPKYVTATKYDINSAFVAQRAEAQGMLLSYLSGTCRWYASRTKANVLKQNKQYKDFRTGKAQELRDAALEDSLGFMHCAYRYRGKVNYRDGVFLTYGTRELLVGPKYVQALAVSARFLAIVALVAVEALRGRDELKTFLNDVNANFRRAERLSAEDVFWRAV